jgi:hypothetical protein
MTSRSNNQFDFVDRHTNLPFSIPLQINTSNIKLGIDAGSINQSYDTVAIGTEAAKTDQQYEGIAIGNRAGKTNQGGQAVSVGFFAGSNFQGAQAVSIGCSAGTSSQGAKSIAIGFESGNANQSTDSISIGNNAGKTSQGNNAIAIGNNAGQTNQGANAIAIGQNTGLANQHARTIVLNASNVTVNSDGTDKLFINPIRDVSNFTSLIGRQLFRSQNSFEVISTRVNYSVRTYSTTLNPTNEVQFPGIAHGITFLSIPMMFGCVTDQQPGALAQNILVSFYQVSTTGFTLILKNMSTTLTVSPLNETYKIAIYAITMS